jgi:hypothetical protein
MTCKEDGVAVLSKIISFRVNQIAQQIALVPTRILDFSFIFKPSNQPVNILWTLVGGNKLNET